MGKLKNNYLTDYNTKDKSEIKKEADFANYKNYRFLYACSLIINFWKAIPEKRSRNSEKIWETVETKVDEMPR